MKIEFENYPLDDGTIQWEAVIVFSREDFPKPEHAFVSPIEFRGYGATSYQALQNGLNYFKKVQETLATMRADEIEQKSEYSEGVKQ